MDGIDAALVEFGDHTVTLHATHSVAYPTQLRDDLLSVSRHSETCGIDSIGKLDRQVGACFRDVTLQLLAVSDTDPAAVAAIGSHGQTLRHSPDGETPYTLQIGDPNVIVAGTGIPTVADFRRQDVALGGQGAPLAPAFHHWLFARLPNASCILNLGGIANITLLPDDEQDVVGFDTGPANTLLDCWTRRHLGQDYDTDGKWSASGAVNEQLLATMMADDYFARRAPKSTGFEYFNEQWLEACLASAAGTDIPAVDVQATLAQLTAQSVADAIRAADIRSTRLLVCGGGTRNPDLMRRLADALPDAEVSSTSRYGLDPEWVECAAFGWLAMRRLRRFPGNLPSVTGASRAALLGAVYR